MAVFVLVICIASLKTAVSGLVFWARSAAVILRFDALKVRRFEIFTRALDTVTKIERFTALAPVLW